MDNMPWLNAIPQGAVILALVYLARKLLELSTVVDRLIVRVDYHEKTIDNIAEATACLRGAPPH